MKQFNINRYRLLLLFIITSMSACNKDFLDRPKPTESITEEEVFKSASGVRSYFNGLYSKMRQPWAPIGATDYNETENWGYTSVNITRVNDGIDIINPSGWYQSDYRHENREPSYRRTVFTWQFFYETINQTNVIIKGVAASSTISDDHKAKLTAEAKALRGWFYFELVREFQFTVAKDANAPGVPVYTEPTSVDNKGKPRGTVAEVYALINEDLQYASQHIGSERLYKSQIILPVVYGMIARTMLEQHKWTEAIEAAQKAREGFALDRDSYDGAYRDMENSTEVMWGFPQTVTGAAQSQYYNTPSSFFEKTGVGYDNFYINSDFVATFSETDIRNLFFISNASPTSQRRYSTNKFGLPGSEEIDLINGQTVPLKEMDFEESQPMMRIAEMYLIEAEANAELGEDAAAQDLLFTLQSDRDEAAAPSGNTGATLINEILLERRKELYGELGIDFLDLRRRQLPLVRAGNHAPAYQFNFPANSKEFILRIPQREIDTNDFIDESDQND